MRVLKNVQIADHLDNTEIITEYLNTVLKEGDTSDVVATLGHTAKAIGRTKIAEETGLSGCLYNTLSEVSKLQFPTLMKVVKAVGGEIQVAPASINIIKKPQR